MPRLCRSNNGVPISASSAFTRLVMLDCTVLSSSAARVTPPVRATAKKVTRSDNSMTSVRFVFKMAEFSRNHLSRTVAGSKMPVQIGNMGYVDHHHAIDRALGYPASDPVAPMDVISGARL